MAEPTISDLTQGTWFSILNIVLRNNNNER
jgi:hypothetical protein